MAAPSFQRAAIRKRQEVGPLGWHLRADFMGVFAGLGDRVQFMCRLAESLENLAAALFNLRRVRSEDRGHVKRLRLNKL